jgi:hypothetical protein
MSIRALTGPTEPRLPSRRVGRPRAIDDLPRAIDLTGGPSFERKRTTRFRLRALLS